MKLQDQDMNLLRSGKRRRLDRLSGLFLFQLDECRLIDRFEHTRESNRSLSIRLPKKKKMYESDERATHQSMRFTVRLRIVYSASARTLCHSRATTSPSAKEMTQTTAVGNDITCCSDWYDDFHVSGDTGSSCRQLL